MSRYSVQGVRIDRRRNYRGPGGGFTLAELLVVVGVIAVLIGILLPVLSRARQAAQMIACAANLQQIGVAVYCYANENRDWLPWADINYLASGSGEHRVITWDDLINRQLGGDFSEDDVNAFYAPRPVPVLACPADQTERQPHTWGPPGAQLHRRSYALLRVVKMGDRDDERDRDFWGIGGQMAGYDPFPFDKPSVRSALCIKKSWIKTPTEQLMVVEVPARGNVLGSFFSYAEQPGAQYYGWITPWDAGKGKSTHGGRWNYLFADGHVAALYAEETVHAPAGASYATTLMQQNYKWTRRTDD